MRISLTVLLLVAMYALPALSLAGNNSVGVPIEGNAITLEDIVYIVQDVMNIGIVIATLAVVAMMVYGGFKMATSGADGKGYTEGKNILYQAMIGALVVFGVGLIVNTIANVAYDPANVLN